MASNSRHHVLYTGVTGNLPRRVFQHKHKLIPGSTSDYNVTRLVYYEMSYYPDVAIAREKEIKGWRRSRKIALIEGINPTGTTWQRNGKTSTTPTPALWVLPARSVAA